MLSIGTSNGANKPFLALVVLDFGILLGEYGIEVVTFNSAGNKKAHLSSAKDHQVEQCSEVKVDQWRFVGLDESPSTALGKDHCLVHQCQCNGLGPQATSTA